MHRAPLRASLGGGAPTSGVGRQLGRSYSPVFVKAHPPALGILAKTPWAPRSPAWTPAGRLLHALPCLYRAPPALEGYWRGGSFALMLYHMCPYAALSLD